MKYTSTIYCLLILQLVIFLCRSLVLKTKAMICLGKAAAVSGSDTHLHRDEIGSNLSVPGIKSCQENTLYKSFEMIATWSAGYQFPLGADDKVCTAKFGHF